jgi:hypothetical protein
LTIVVNNVGFEQIDWFSFAQQAYRLLMVVINH